MYFCILATNAEQQISSGICNSTKNVRYLRMNLTKHVCDLYTKNYKKKKKKKERKPSATVEAKTPKGRLWVPHLAPTTTSRELGAV